MGFVKGFKRLPLTGRKKTLFLISDFKNDFANPVPATLKGFIYYSKSMRYDTIGYREFQLSELQGDSKKFPKEPLKIF